MRWHLIRHELRQIRRGLIAASAISWLLIAMMLGKAESFVGNEEMADLLETMPKGLLEAFGITPESFGSFEGYFASQPYSFYVLALGLFAAVWSFASVAKERDRGTDEFLFSLPHARSRILLSKAAAHLLAVTFVYATTAGLVLSFGETTTGVDDPAGIFALMTAGYTLCLFFMGIGYAATSAAGSERAAMGTGIGLVTASFALTLLGGAGRGLRELAELSPFKLYDPAETIARGLTPAGLAVTLGVYAAGLALGLWTLKRRDLG